MKSTEPNQGKYNNVSKSITHELKQTHKPPVKKAITSHSASTYVKTAAAAAAAATVCPNVDTAHKKWAVSNTRNTLNKNVATNARKSETVGIDQKPNDWFVSNARTFNVKAAESAKDILRLASSMSKSNTATSNTQHQHPSYTLAPASASPSSRQLSNSSKVEVVSNSHANHSNSVKAPVTNRQSVNASNGQTWMPAVSAAQQPPQQQQPTFRASPCFINRAPAKATHPLNGVEETNSTLHKSITNQTVAAEHTPSSNKSIESGKTRKNASTERKYKQKDAKSIHEKRKNGGVGKQSVCLPGDGSKGVGNSRKCVTNQIVHHESLQRLPLHATEMNNDPTRTANATIATTNGITQCSVSAAIVGKQSTIGNREWQSPESYIYDEINAANATSEYPEQMSCMQTFWFRDLPNGNLLTREQRLENKRDNLRRQAVQYAQVLQFIALQFINYHSVNLKNDANMTFNRMHTGPTLSKYNAG